MLDERTHMRIWPILIVGFGTIVLLIALSGGLAFVRATNTYRGISALHDSEHETERRLNSLRTDIAVSAILMRDALLDTNSSTQNVHAEFVRERRDTERQLKRLELLIPQPQSEKLQALRNQIGAYWQSLESIVASKQKPPLTFAFIQNELLPRREAALRVVAEIEQLSIEAFNQRRKEINIRNARLTSYVSRTIAITPLIALVIAGLSIYRIFKLERFAAQQHREMQAAQLELRNVSRQLVTAQEIERKALSRDLHDQVGQVLTALRMSLGNIQLSLEAAGMETNNELEISKRLVSHALRSTRDLAMGLRPSMLDDLGLAAALEWHVRQHSRISGVPVTLNLSCSLQHLSDAQRTCVYRTVQEALNNSAKHAHARNVTVNIENETDAISIVVQDDGVGFDASARVSHSLGLLGMRERIEQLGGSVFIRSETGHGTLVCAKLPVVEQVT